MKIIKYMLIVAFALLQTGMQLMAATNSPVCEDLPNIDYPQPYPNAGWNQFDVGNDDGLEGNGSLSYTLDAMDGLNNIAIGLDHDPIPGLNFKTIDYTFYIVRNSNNKNIVRVYENGTLRGTFINTSNSIDGYTFRIEKTGDVVDYYINDVLEYTSTVASTEHLYYDNACYRRNGSVFSASGIELCLPAPPDATTIKVNSAYVNDKIRIRWMTTDMTMWEHAIKVGYTIERLTVAENGNYLSKTERIESYVLLEEGYMPKSQAEMESATSNPNEGTLAHQLIGDNNTEESIMGVGAGEQSLAKAVQQKKMRDMRYFASHVLAEKSFEMACAMGMAYEDDTIESNKEYAYIITLTEPLN